MIIHVKVAGDNMHSVLLMIIHVKVAGDNMHSVLPMIIHVKIAGDNTHSVLLMIIHVKVAKLLHWLSSSAKIYAYFVPTSTHVHLHTPMLTIAVSAKNKCTPSQ